MEKSKEKGHPHPLTEVIKQISGIFDSLGFEIAQGPELETEYYNFDSLNMPAHHPARDMQDTFWFSDGRLLRTQTSPVQMRYMQSHKPPIRIIAPGTVFRYEATDSRKSAQFYQLEGLMIDKDVSVAHLKAFLDHFLKKLFGDDVKSRFRPSYFPFVEPGFEVDASCFKCGGDGCTICKHSGWVEILGAGMVHPYVLAQGGIHPRDWRGWAFGLGIDRIAMLKYEIDDIRLLYSGDLRFINQF